MIPFLWKAYQFLPHKSGTSSDADFWFLVQICVSQFVGLILSAGGLWRQSPGSIQYWLPPTLLAVVCIVLAVPLYLFTPTEWSNFAVIVAGAIQSVLILQLAIAED